MICFGNIMVFLRRFSLQIRQPKPWSTWSTVTGTPMTFDIMLLSLMMVNVTMAQVVVVPRQNALTD